MKSYSDYLKVVYSLDNLIIEDLIECNSFKLSHPIDYQWLKSPRKLGKRSRNQKIGYPRIGYLYRLVTLLLECELFSHDSEDPFHEISKKTLANYVPSRILTRLKKILINLGIMEEDPFYRPKVFADALPDKFPPTCKRYCLTEPYRDSMPVEVTTDFGIQERILKKPRHRNRERNEQLSPELQWLRDQIFEIEILPEAFEGIENYEFKSLRAKGLTKLLLRRIEGLKAGFTDQVFFGKDSTIGRIHSPITTMKKDFRRYLRYQGSPIATVDAVACHPFLLLSLYNEPSLKNDPEAQIEAKGYYSLWDLRNGKRDFYTAFNDLGELEMERNDMKSAFYTEFLYCFKPKEGNGEKIAAVYEKHFPKLYGLIKRIKSARYLPDDDPYHKTKNAHNHGQLSVMMFRRETRAFIDESVGEIFSGDKFWVVTIHDALCCHPDNVDKVEDILRRKLKAETGFDPVLDVEIPGSDEQAPCTAKNRRDRKRKIGNSIHLNRPIVGSKKRLCRTQQLSEATRNRAARLGVEGVSPVEKHPVRVSDLIPDDPESFLQ